MSLKLRTFTDDCPRVLTYLAIESGRRVTIAQIGDLFRISEDHLVKVVHFLGQGGWLASSRGRSGGLSLARRPQNIGNGALVRQTEGANPLASCFGEKVHRGAIAPICQLRSVLNQVAKALYGVLDAYTLADLAQDHNCLGKALFFDQTLARGHSTQIVR